MAVDEDVDKLLRTAIGGKHLLRFRYKGNERIVEPHDYGIQKGIVRLLCWQVGGKSKGRIPGWRWIDVDDIEEQEMLDRRFAGRREAGPASIISGMKFSSVLRRRRNRAVKPGRAPLRVSGRARVYSCRLSAL